MVLYVGADGRIVDGPLPAGDPTKVLALVDGRAVEVLVINNPGGGGVPPGASLVQDSLGTLDVETLSTESNSAPSDADWAALVEAFYSEANAAPGETHDFIAQMGSDDTNPTPTETNAVELVAADEPNPTPTESSAFGLAVADEPNPTPTDANAVEIGMPVEANPTPTESNAVELVAAVEANPVPAETSTLAADASSAESNDAPTEASTVAINQATEASATPTEAKTSQLNVWLSGCTGSSGNVTNPASANGSNDAAFAVIATVSLGATTATLTSAAMGSAKLPTGTPYTGAICRPYFKTTNNSPIGSTWSITATWTGGSAVIDGNIGPSGNAAADHSTGDLTFDLFAAGMNTVAKAQSLVMTATTTDSVAGVAKNLQLDAVAIEIPNAV